MRNHTCLTPAAGHMIVQHVAQPGLLSDCGGLHAYVAACGGGIYCSLHPLISGQAT